MGSGPEEKSGRRGVLRLMLAALAAAVAPRLARRAHPGAAQPRRPGAAAAVEARFWRRA